MERMNPEVDEELMMISQYYLDLDLDGNDGIYAQFLPEQGVGVGAAKPRRRRRKKRLGGGDEVVTSAQRKRKLSEKQVRLLEESFGSEQKLESERKERLAAEVGLDPRQVAVWFQNRRARWKAKKLEEEYSNLKSHLDAAVLHKCRLETELLKLKEQLHEAQKEIQRLSSSSEGGNNSPCSSFTMDPQHLATNFGVEHDYYNGFHYNYGIGIGMEWDTLYYV